MRMMTSLATGLLMTMGLAVEAEAATYNVSGTTTSGGLVTGSVDYDGSSFTNVDVTTTGKATKHFNSMSIDYDGMMEVYTIYMGGDTNFNGELSGPFTGSTINFTGVIDLTVQGRVDWHYANGSFTLAAPIVTPIPAALPLAASALVGLGGLGWLKRRRMPADAAAA